MRLGKPKSAKKLSGAIIARRYLELQRLRDEVKKAEASIRVLTLPNSARAISKARTA